EGAQEGMESTKDLVSKRGRSSRLGERSRGHIDPGAASSYFIIEAFFGSLMDD
ncbi:DAK2 domain-containing protein, partial [Candidatus Sordicultor fermentans]|uniref:DAK2 domain-containing protein n=1 Tax=Candidatus Sordicultor fermentans TaxID=1953203 RepID=UPI0016B1E58B|nr:DAK2 domain-containing protein [Candidatus Atribacteria bacterium]